MDEKWNLNLSFAKIDPKNEHFSSFWQCAWQIKCIFATFLKNFPSRGFHSNYFLHHFPFHF